MKVGYVPYYNDQEIRWEDPTEFYGGCVGKGWVPLLIKLTEKLELLGWDGRLEQVKEKYGTLRFYWANNIDGLMGEIAEDVVDEAEARSAYICQSCGEYGRTRGEGWLVTLCDEHWKERQGERRDAKELV